MMGAEVYADGNEIACKAGDGKVVAAFPDVCLSPPSPPAGPVPVPYPNTSFSKDMKNGSKTVKIKGKEVMVRDKSYYKTSPLGDEAATRSFGANVVTHVITGKTYFVAWSMDVKFEGKNVDRHIDLTTSNHGSLPPGVPTPAPNASSQERAAWEEKWETCSCCLGPLHESQRGGRAVSEDDWYGLNEKIPDDPPRPGFPRDISPGAAKRWNRWSEDCAELQKRRKQLRRRKDVIKRARQKGCESLPEPPCNAYRVITAAQTSAAEEEWGNISNKYKEIKRVPRVPFGSKGERATVHHRVPKSAGGCPGALPPRDGNLVPDNELSRKCKNIDKQLTKIQTNCTDQWQKGVWTP